MTDLLPVIKWKLRSVMADRKMTAVRLSELLNVHRVTVTNWANSNEIPPFKEPSKILNQICWHLECNLLDLFEYQRDEVLRDE